MSRSDYAIRDFKPRARPQKGLRRVHFHAAAVVSAVIAVGALIWPGPEAEATRHHPDPLDLPIDNLTLPLALPESRFSPEVLPLEEPAPVQWQTVKVTRGDTLSAIFERLGLSPGELHTLLQAGPDTKRLTRLLPGQTLQFHIEQQRLQGLRHHLSPTATLNIRRDSNGFRASIDERQVETRFAHAGGVIESSLFNAGKAAGLSDRLIMEMVAIFGWDVDFALDIRQGDQFVLLYEERWLDGEKLDEGEIVAAEFTNQGRVFRAVRFTGPDGRSAYFDPEGHSMRKAFLRSPVDFRRISSRFQTERYHPVLGKKRPHRGVDYAAAVGTPIKAAGDGKIIFRGWKGGYGRTVIVQHGGKYTTLYAHLSKYRSGRSVGSRVQQGETIGYVGQSGLATGPHLHYEFRVAGVHRNPLTVKLPKAEPIPKQHKAAFALVAKNLLGQIDVLKRTQLAMQP